MTAQSTLPPLWTKLGTHSKLVGLDLHSPLTLPDEHDLTGVGSTGRLYSCIDWMANNSFSLLQLNPLCDTLGSASPYDTASYFSYNPVHVSVAPIVSRPRFLTQIKPELERYHRRCQIIDSWQGNGQQDPRYWYTPVRMFRLACLRWWYQHQTSDEQTEFEQFCAQASDGMVGYAFYQVLAEQFGSHWQHWPNAYRHPQSHRLPDQYPELVDEAQFWLFTQFILQQQWLAVSGYAAKKGIYLVQDKAIYPYDYSCDVWLHQDIFYLNQDGTPQVVSGCDNPNDPFGRQVWGHAVYQFAEKPESVTKHIISVLEHMSQTSSVIRLDHVIAYLWKYFVVDPNTREGAHKPALGIHLLRDILTALPKVFFIAEDVGVIDFATIDLPLQQTGMMGMVCPQWSGQSRYTDIAAYTPWQVAVSSTHDTQTLTAWCNKHDYSPQTILQALLDSPAQVVMITAADLMQDERPYNTPGTRSMRNWSRMLRSSLSRSSWVSKLDWSSRAPHAINWQQPQVLAVWPRSEMVTQGVRGDVQPVSIAVSQNIKHICISTNLYDKHQSSDQWWERWFFWDDPRVTVYNYADKTVVVEVNLLIHPDTPKGRYQVAGRVEFAGGNVEQLCTFEQNIQLQVEDDQDS